MKASDVVDFWRNAGPERWFKKDAAFDAEFKGRFEEAHFAAARRELDGWAATAEGALAVVLLLDQYPRNSFRGSAHMYATDALARHFTLQLIARALDAQVEPALRTFCYMPLMHSEALADQERLFELLGPDATDARKYALVHRDIIARFGRFPHRNAELGRDTTPEEQAFLDAGGFAG